MKRNAYIAGLAATVALAGCGSASNHSTTTTKAAVAPKQTAQQAGTGYYNMDTLAADIKAKANGDTNIGGGVTLYGSGGITFVTCMPAGSGRAECHGEAVDGSQANVGVTISADGNQYMTDASN